MSYHLLRRNELTFKANAQRGRHGWLRLTPAFSALAAQMALERAGSRRHAIDPFAGTGTTALVCAEHSTPCDLAEINPFLSWLCRVKTRNYTPSDTLEARLLAQTAIQKTIQGVPDWGRWIPPIHNIERWWAPRRQKILASLLASLWENQDAKAEARDLVLIAFCRVAIEWSSAAFNHQSLSFKTPSMSLFEEDETIVIMEHFLKEVENILSSAEKPVGAPIRVFETDSRSIDEAVVDKYDLVITSPPYPNRISYVRELRPYMYWLGYLRKARDAGDLDWQAIGGTWGAATSRLAAWQPDNPNVNTPLLRSISERIAKNSPILANYVLRYFHDMATHLSRLTNILQPGAKVFYIVGNAKFYDTLVPTEELLKQQMLDMGYRHVTIEPLRKRNSKKELYEYLISADWQK